MTLTVPLAACRGRSLGGTPAKNRRAPGPSRPRRVQLSGDIGVDAASDSAEGRNDGSGWSEVGAAPPASPIRGTDLGKGNNFGEKRFPRVLSGG